VVAAVGAVPLETHVDGAAEVVHGEAARDAGAFGALLGSQAHEVEEEGIDAVLELPGDLELLPHVTVDPVAVVHAVLLALHVDVGGAVLDPVRDHFGDKLGERLVVFFGDVEIIDLLGALVDLDRVDIGLRGARGARDHLDRLGDLGGGCQNLRDFELGILLREAVLCGGIPGIRDGDVDLFGVLVERHEHAPVEKIRIVLLKQVAIDEILDLEEEGQPGDGAYGGEDADVGTRSRDVLAGTLPESAGQTQSAGQPRHP
jgi:hypothetical protein